MNEFRRPSNDAQIAEHNRRALVFTSDWAFFSAAIEQPSPATRWLQRAGPIAARLNAEARNDA